MFVPKIFKTDNPDFIYSFLKENSFGTLVNSDNNIPVACHIPFIIKKADDCIILEGHIAYANDQRKILEQEGTALVIFLGVNGYISSSVYGHPNVPTWNYKSVHLYGKVELLSSSDLDQHFNELVDLHEHDRKPRLDLTSLPEDLLQAYKKETFGFRIKSTSIEAAFKLSQNRNEADFYAIIEDLKKDPVNKPLIEAMLSTR